MAEGERGSGHPSPVEWERFLLGELSPAQAAPLTAHLIHGCDRCREAMAPWISVLFSSGNGLPEPSANAGSQYDFPFFKALANARRYAATVAREGVETRQEPLLRKVPEPQALSLERGTERDQARCEALLKRSWALRFSDPEAMLLTAELAVNLAAQLDPGAIGGAALADLQARAWGELGNARRVADDLAGAESALGRALERAGEGSGDPLLLARLTDLTASLYTDQRRFDEARRLLDLVYALYLREGDAHSAGRALISKGISSSYASDVEEVIHLLRGGLALLDARREPKLVLVALHNLIWYLVETGQVTQAASLFSQCRPLYECHSERLQSAKARWLEGRIAAALGDDPHAEKMFRQAQTQFEAVPLLYDMALVSLDLASLWLRAGRTREILAVVRDTINIFRSRGIHREAIGMLTVLRDALRKDQISEAMIRSVAIQLMRLDEPPQRQAGP